jgi:hypothetical protein
VSEKAVGLTNAVYQIALSLPNMQGDEVAGTAPSCK